MIIATNRLACPITLTDVLFEVDGATLLKNITFSTDQHRIGIIGRNGSGKSTLAKLLCGLIAPSMGSLRVAGVDVANDRPKAIKTVGMLFQNPDHQIIFPTVEEELGFGLEQIGLVRQDARSAALAALADFGVAHWAVKSVSMLSQGQRHLVCLIAVLLMKPRLLVLDEPYAGLDIPTTMQLTQQLDRIEATIVHISHQPDTLVHYDRILWLEAGEILMDGNSETVLPAFTTRMQQIGRADALV
jgi:biotin transport system ATP-binding protein